MHKSSLLFTAVLVVFSNSLFGQAKLPSDEALAFHKSRRDQLRKQLPPNSVAVIFANPTRNRANDVDYVYHQDPNFFYLTGWREPQSVLLVYSAPQSDEKGTYAEKIYIQERDARAEQWNGYRLGLEGAKAMGFDRVALRDSFVQAPPDFSDFDEVLIFDFKNDERDLAGDPYDLFQLKRTFKEAINFPADFNRTKYSIQQSIRTATPETFERLKA